MKEHEPNQSKFVHKLITVDSFTMLRSHHFCTGPKFMGRCAGLLGSWCCKCNLDSRPNFYMLEKALNSDWWEFCYVLQKA